MTERTEFLKTVKERFAKVQGKASERIASFNDDARKAFNGLVEKGRASQQDWLKRTRVDLISRRVRESRVKAQTYVNTTARSQVAFVAGGLRKFAARIETVVPSREATTAADAQSAPALH